MNVECRADRTQRIVIMRDRRTKNGHDTVAYVLVDCATVALDDRVHRLEIAVEQGVGLFRA